MLQKLFDVYEHGEKGLSTECLFGHFDKREKQAHLYFQFLRKWWLFSNQIYITISMDITVSKNNKIYLGKDILSPRLFNKVEGKFKNMQN